MTDMLIIEKSVLDELAGRIETLNRKMEQLNVLNGTTDKTWLDNQEACQRLSVSKRTLQNLRDSGILPFTKIGAKVYYKPVDIDRLLSLGYTGKVSSFK